MYVLAAVLCALVVSGGCVGARRPLRVYTVRMYIYVFVSTHCLHVDSITTRVGTCTLHHVYVYVRECMVSASVKHALAATVLA